MIIDIHNHLSPKGNLYRMEAETYLEAMDASGVEKAVILGKDYGHLGDRHSNNLDDEDVAEFVRAHPDRFIGFTAIHPDRDIRQNVQRVIHAVDDLGLQGIKLNPASGFYPNDQRLYPAYQKAQELGIPVVFHSGVKPPQEGSRLKYCPPMYLDDVVVDFPDLTVIIAHAGYPWVDETIMVALYAQNVFVDLSTLNQLSDVMGRDVTGSVLKQLHDALGAGRIVFGSDGIFNFDPIIETVRQAEYLSEREREQILWKNAAGILNI